MIFLNMDTDAEAGGDGVRLDSKVMIEYIMYRKN